MSDPLVLLPCPFCGSIHVDVFSDRDGPVRFYAGQCQNCGAQGPTGIYVRDGSRLATEEDLRGYGVDWQLGVSWHELWNKRKER